MENYNGEKFLDKLYKDLYLIEEVKHTKTNKDSKEQNIRKYLDRIEKAHKGANTERRKEALKGLYYDKYVIKAASREVTMNQRESLSKWLDYLMDANTIYPMWAKYWAFQCMVKMGSYDEASGTYQRRTNRTISPFVDANPEIIANCIESAMKSIDKDEIDDEEISKLVDTGNFSKLYTLFERRYKKNIAEKSTVTDGIWIKYNQGSK